MRMNTGDEFSKIDEEARALGILPEGETSSDEDGLLRRRAAEFPDEDDAMGRFTLVQREDGSVEWQGSALDALQTSGRRSGLPFFLQFEGAVRREFKFPKLSPNQVIQTLEKVEADHCADQVGKKAFYGLRRWVEGTTPGVGSLEGSASQPVGPTPGKRALVLIHGTFSNNGSFIQGFQKSDFGRDFLHRAAKHYPGGVLTFDHQSLAVGPLLNAVDLAGLFAGTDAEVDVVCHSRGGVVTRWWFEAFGHTIGKNPRAVLVGCPLAGTSIAAPGNLRNTLSLFTNIGQSLEQGVGHLVPPGVFRIVSLALLKVLGSLTSIAAKTPIADTVVALVPGIGGQSRVSNNLELRRLHQQAKANPPAYFAITSDFEPDQPGWEFWKWFNKGQVVSTVADAGADFLFEGANDLVVDTASMRSLYGGLDAPDPRPDIAASLDFGRKDRIHHLNYFDQRKTIDFITKSLGIP